MSPKTTCIVSAAPVAPALPEKRSRWCLPMKQDCCGTSNGFFGAAFRRCRHRYSKSSNRPRRRPVKTVPRRRRVAATAVTINTVAGDAGMEIAIRAVPQVQARVRIPAPDRIRERAPHRIREREVSVRPEAVSARSASLVRQAPRAASAPIRADSARIQDPSSDASSRTRRSLASIRACCRSRSASPRIRRNTPLRAASGGRFRR